jgi:REP element-mobilizing transposase RayT
MGSTFFSLHYHIMFSTKERRPTIRAEWKPRVHSYMGGIIRGMNGVAEIVNGVEDHVHSLISLRPVHSLADLMRDLKKGFDELDKEFRPSIRVAGRICRLYGQSRCGACSATVYCESRVTSRAPSIPG